MPQVTESDIAEILRERDTDKEEEVQKTAKSASDLDLGVSNMIDSYVQEQAGRVRQSQMVQMQKRRDRLDKLAALFFANFGGDFRNWDEEDFQAFLQDRGPAAARPLLAVIKQAPLGFRVDTSTEVSYFINVNSLWVCNLSPFFQVRVSRVDADSIVVCRAVGMCRLPLPKSFEIQSTALCCWFTRVSEGSVEEPVCPTMWARLDNSDFDF